MHYSTITWPPPMTLNQLDIRDKKLQQLIYHNNKIIKTLLFFKNKISLFDRQPEIQNLQLLSTKGGICRTPCPTPSTTFIHSAPYCFYSLSVLLIYTLPILLIQLSPCKLYSHCNSTRLLLERWRLLLTQCSTQLHTPNLLTALSLALSAHSMRCSPTHADFLRLLAQSLTPIPHTCPTPLLICFCSLPSGIMICPLYLLHSNYLNFALSLLSEIPSSLPHPFYHYQLPKAHFPSLLHKISSLDSLPSPFSLLSYS